MMQNEAQITSYIREYEDSGLILLAQQPLCLFEGSPQRSDHCSNLKSKMSGSLKKDAQKSYAIACTPTPHIFGSNKD